MNESSYKLRQNPLKKNSKKWINLNFFKEAFASNIQFNFENKFIQ